MWLDGTGADACCRNLCLRTYIPPHQISREENAVQIAKELHAGDWRRCYIEQCVLTTAFSLLP